MLKLHATCDRKVLNLENGACWVISMHHESEWKFVDAAVLAF